MPRRCCHAFHAKALATAQNVFVGREVAGRFGQDALLLEAGELYGRRADDTPGDVVLHRENVVGLGIVCFGPDMPPSRGLGQFGADANAIASTTDAALKQVSRIQQAPDLGG